MPTKVIVARNTRIPPKDLPTSIEELRQFALNALQQMQHACDEQDKLHREVDQAKRDVIVAKQQTIELTSTVEAQKKRLEQSERTIKELLRALKGKKRERLDPNQLLLFELGELEQLIDEAAKADEAQPNDEACHANDMVPKNFFATIPATYKPMPTEATTVSI